MLHIAISQPKAKRWEKGTFLTRVLNQCIRLLPFMRLPGYFPCAPWDLVDPLTEQGQADSQLPVSPSRAGKPASGPH